MPKLTVAADDELIRLLRQRAAANGRTIDEEHRMILETVLRSSKVSDIPELSEEDYQT
jgi:plasmid stability protein